MILLGVNIDHAATLRQARYRQHSATAGGAVEPDPVALALIAERAGADGITVHLREDRRHIQERDVWRLRECMGTRLNLEMACTPAMVDFALRLNPHSVCLVPESREEVTTEGGLDVVGHRGKVQEVIEAMRGAELSPAFSLTRTPRRSLPRPSCVHLGLSCTPERTPTAIPWTPLAAPGSGSACVTAQRVRMGSG